MLPVSKVCLTCGLDLPLLAYGEYKEGKYGRRSSCNKCRAKEEKARRLANPQTEEQKEAARQRAKKWAFENKGRKASSSRAWARSHPEKVSASSRRWKEKNPDKVREIYLRWLRSHPEVAAQASKIWREKYPERYRASLRSWRIENAHSWRVRYAREQSVVSDFTCVDWESVQQEFNYACAYCLSQDAKLTIDHVVPISKGGDHTKANVVPACKRCNSRKKDRSIFYMIGYRGA